MRVSARSAATLLKTSLSRPAERIGRLYTQLSSGQRLTELSDDPLAAMRTVRLHSALASLDSQRSVLSAASRLLGAADTALGTMGEALQGCGSVALRAQSPTLGEAERRALAEQVRSYAATVQTAGNQSVQGVYVFGGTATDSSPLAANSDPDSSFPVTYGGNDQALQYQVSPAETMPVSFSGAEVFNYAGSTGERAVAGVDTDVFSLLKDLADSLERGDTNRVADLAGQVDACREQVVNVRGRAGLLVQRQEAAGQACDWSELQLEDMRSAEEDVDLATAITDLRNEETAYQAVMGMVSQLLQLPSLFEVQW